MSSFAYQLPITGSFIVLFKQMKFTKKLELYAVWAIYPAVAAATMVGGYKIFIWSFGGKECFRYTVIRQPQDNDWVKTNPKLALGRTTPLSSVPEYLETPGHNTGGGEHDHHNNY